MQRSFLIVGLNDIHVDPNGGFIGVRLQASDQMPVGLGLHPEMTHSFALGLLQALSDSTNRGIFPPQLHPMMQPTTNLRGNPSGLEVEYDLSNGLRLASEMPWSVAREFAEKVLALCDANDASPTAMN